LTVLHPYFSSFECPILLNPCPSTAAFEELDGPVGSPIPQVQRDKPLFCAMFIPQVVQGLAKNQPGWDGLTELFHVARDF
jgi:hypothetical protein